MVDRDTAVLEERIQGSTLRAIGEQHGLTPEGVRSVVGRVGRRHIDEIVLGMWAAQKEGALLVLTVPSGLDSEQRLAVRYLDWVLHEMPEYVDAVVHYRPAGFVGGFVFALEDRAFTPNQEADRP